MWASFILDQEKTWQNQPMRTRHIQPWNQSEHDTHTSVAHDKITWGSRATHGKWSPESEVECLLMKFMGTPAGGLRLKKHIIFHIPYIIVPPLCPSFLKCVDFYKAHCSEKRGVLWLASYPVHCDWQNTSSVWRKCYALTIFGNTQHLHDMVAMATILQRE